MGFWFASLVASDSDMHFQSMADVSSAHVLCWDTPGWLNNGGVAGGHFLAADSGIGYAALQYGQGYYLVSNTEIAVGPTATLNLRVGGQSGNPSINPSILALAFGVVPPVAIPGLLGEFALKASPMVVFGGPTSATADDVADLVVPATDVSLKGLTLHLQGLVNPTDQSLGASFTSTVSPKFN
jgi:hypothetical protein